MPLIYLKLGSVNHYEDERLSFELFSAGKSAGVLDYDNLNEVISGAINAGQLVQITEAEYNNILNSNVPPETINITTNYLVTLQNFIDGCPEENAVFFLRQGNQWYKVLWATLKNCIGVSGVNIKFRVGEVDPPYPIPAAGDTEFQHDSLIGKTARELTVKSGGVEIYEESFYDPAEIAVGDIDYYQLDSETGTITRPATFLDKEFVSIK